MLAMPDLAQIQAPAAQAMMQDFLYQQQWMNEHDQVLAAEYYAAVQEQMAQAMQEAEAVHWSDSAYNMQRSLEQSMSVVERPTRVLHAGMALQPQLWAYMCCSPPMPATGTNDSSASSPTASSKILIETTG